MELAFAGLHQLCAPMLDRLERLPGSAARCARHGVRAERGGRAGSLPGRAGRAEPACRRWREERPLVCVVDDAQWLDRASAQALAFVARRLLAESVALVFAARERRRRGSWPGLPELVVEGLRDGDARALLALGDPGPLDERVRDRIVAETRGNPLALLELPRGLTPAELAGGFGLPDALPLSGRIEESFRRRLEPLPGRDAAAVAGRGGGAGGRAGAGVARGRAARDRGATRRRRRPRPACSSSAPGCGFAIRWCARRSTGRRRRQDRQQRAPRAGGGHRSRGRSRSPRLAPRAGGGRARRGRRRGARALGRAGAGARRAGRGGRLPRAGCRC